MLQDVLTWRSLSTAEDKVHSAVDKDSQFECLAPFQLKLLDNSFATDAPHCNLVSPACRTTEPPNGGSYGASEGTRQLWLSSEGPLGTSGQEDGTCPRGKP